MHGTDFQVKDGQIEEGTHCTSPITDILKLLFSLESCLPGRLLQASSE